MFVLFWIAIVLHHPKVTHLYVTRYYFAETYTIGHLFIEDEYFCETLEDKVRPLSNCKAKVYGKTAIPCGTYTVTLTYAPHFKQTLPWIRNVPCFSEILIHAGHNAQQTKGCILIGINDSKGHLSCSQETVNKLVKQLQKKKNITITISQQTK